MNATSCKACDQGNHSACDGIARIIDQDGHSRYICDCYCRYQINAANRSRERVDATVARLHRDLTVGERTLVVERLMALDGARRAGYEGKDAT